MDFFPSGSLHGPHDKVRVRECTSGKPEPAAHRLDEVEGVPNDDHRIGDLEQIVPFGPIELVGETSLDIGEQGLKNLF